MFKLFMENEQKKYAVVIKCVQDYFSHLSRVLENIDKMARKPANRKFITNDWLFKLFANIDELFSELFLILNKPVFEYESKLRLLPFYTTALSDLKTTQMKDELNKYLSSKGKDIDGIVKDLLGLIKMAPEWVGFLQFKSEFTLGQLANLLPSGAVECILKSGETPSDVDWRPNETVPEDYYSL